MPRTVTRDAAIRAIREDRAPLVTGSDPRCLVCEIQNGQLATGATVTARGDLVAFLPRYGVRWGHVVIAPRQHVESAEEGGRALWRALADLAWDVQCSLTRVLEPLRCYSATLGSDGQQPMTSSHLHTHVIPVSRAEDRPASVLTWQHGVVTAEPYEFEQLAAQIRRGMPEDES